MSEKRFSHEHAAKIPMWVAGGLSNEWIAGRIGISIQSLKTLCSVHGISLERKRYQLNAREPLDGCTIPLTLLLTPSARNKLHAKSKQMNLDPHALAAYLLRIVLNEDMVDAVLDEDEPK